MAESLETLIGRVAGDLEQAGAFFGHGTDNAHDEAHWLVLHAAGLPVDQLVEDYSLSVSADVCEAVQGLLKQRIQQRVPLAYLINSAWFAGLEFYVDERVLVPRSPIAELILDGFRDWLEPESVTDVLDLCTGSGCIGIACTYAFPNARIVASDLSRDALEVAEINVGRHQLTELVTLRESDVFSAIDNKFDLIVSNPPYVDAADMSALHDEFKHEPEMGLAAGDDGLDIVDTILAQASNFLTDRGILVVEVGNSAPQLEEKYPQLPFLWLEFASGGGGVFVLTADELRSHSS